MSFRMSSRRGVEDATILSHGLAGYEFGPDYYGLWLLEKLGLAKHIRIAKFTRRDAGADGVNDPHDNVWMGLYLARSPGVLQPLFDGHTVACWGC